LLIVGMVLSVFWTIPETVQGGCVLSSGVGTGQVVALAAGHVGEIYVEIGDLVQQGQTVAELYLANQAGVTGKIASPFAGRVLEVRVAQGQAVNNGTPVVSLELGGAHDLEAIIYVPAAEVSRIRAGQPVQVLPATARREESGFMLGQVMSVAEYPASAQSVLRRLGSSELAQAILARDSAPVEVRARLIREAGAAGGYRWSSPQGGRVMVFGGMACSAEIVVDQKRLAELVLPVR
jgi:HlyD family secretion protein